MRKIVGLPKVRVGKCFRHEVQCARARTQTRPCLRQSGNCWHSSDDGTTALVTVCETVMRLLLLLLLKDDNGRKVSAMSVSDPIE